MKHLNDCTCGACNSTSINDNELNQYVHEQENSRREFLKSTSRLGLGSALFSAPIAASALNQGDSAYKSNAMSNNKAVLDGKASKLTLLHTADIHSQLMTHDEFFVENGKNVFKKRGGFATLKTMINAIRNENKSNTLVLDGGDCFQGSGVAAMSQGKAIVPLINNIGYDVMLPGNWEVVYGKEMMMKDMFSYDGVKVCANMFHKTNDNRNGDLIFPPYFIKNIAGIKI
ncbi:MAG: hypothetical protein RL634_512, partial [Bacteroidota bacterium]